VNDCSVKCLYYPGKIYQRCINIKLQPAGLHNPEHKLSFTAIRMSITEILKIYPNEGKMVALVTTLMVCVSAGAAIGSPGIEALFYTRFGVQFLPHMYTALGMIILLTSLGITGLLGRVNHQRLYVLLPLVLSILLIVARLIVYTDPNWFYPVLWLGMNVYWTLLNLFTWGLAGSVCDTRQAKRLFPLFGAGGILGLTIGGLVTKPLVGWFGTENLVIVWAVSLIAGLFLAREIIRYRVPEKKRRHRAPITIIEDLRSGFTYARHSPLLRWMTYAAVLFAILYYSVVYPFAKAVSVEFSHEDEITAFLGVFQGLSMGATFLTALFISNRFYARLGFMTAIFAFPLIYFLGFTALAIAPLFSVLVVFRFMQLLWSEGISEGANQAMYNLVPSGLREQTRAFVRGVANPFGVSIVGVVLLIGDQLGSPYFVYLLGMVGAAITALLVWRARKQYGRALFETLKKGQSQIFFSEEEPFGGFRRDATAVTALIDGMKSQDESVRRVSAEILAQIDAPEAIEVIVEALNDADDGVRVASLRAISRIGIESAVPRVVNALKDNNPEVRFAAVKSMYSLSKSRQEYIDLFTPMLDDPDPRVKNIAATYLLIERDDLNAEDVLIDLLNHAEIPIRVEAIRSLGKWATQRAYRMAEKCLKDPYPAIRQQAVLILARIDPDQCVHSLVEMLGDDDSGVRKASATALGQIGEKALERVLEALSNPTVEQGVLIALEYLPINSNDPKLLEYIHTQIEKADYYHDLWKLSQGYISSSEITGLLRELLRKKALHHATNALKSLAVMEKNEELKLAISNLFNDNVDQRAYALEILETCGKPEIVRPLTRLWEDERALKTDQDEWINLLLNDQDTWLRSAAFLVLMDGKNDSEKPLVFRQLSKNDTAELSLENKSMTTNGDWNMETLKTISLMERIIFLRKVSLFANLELADLKRIAEIAGEHLFTDGEIIAEQGELGEEMYIIVSGIVRVLTHPQNGDETEIARRVAGEVVGEMSVITQQPRMATLIAEEEVRALCIEHQDFEAILRLYPETSLSVMRMLCNRVVERA
jgi:HEAT repeat protein